MNLDDYTAMAQAILDGLGGAQNVRSAMCCITRLRVTVDNPLLVDECKICSSGVAGVICQGQTTVQVIIGAAVPFVMRAFEKLL